MIIAFANIRDALSIYAGTAIPPSVGGAVHGISATGSVSVGFADTLAVVIFDVIIFITVNGSARGTETSHCYGVLWFFEVAVMATFAAVG